MYNDIWHKINQNINLSIPIIERKDVYLEIKKVTIFLNSLKLLIPRFFPVSSNESGCLSKLDLSGEMPTAIYLITYA